MVAPWSSGGDGLMRAWRGGIGRQTGTLRCTAGGVAQKIEVTALRRCA